MGVAQEGDMIFPGGGIDTSQVNLGGYFAGSGIQGGIHQGQASGDLEVLGQRQAMTMWNEEPVQNLFILGWRWATPRWAEYLVRLQWWV